MPRVNVYDDIEDDDLPEEPVDRRELMLARIAEDQKQLGRDPALLGYPPTLPIEVALRTATNAEICKSYNISKDQWDQLTNDPVFRGDVAKAMEFIQQEGMTFKVKAKLQAEEFLKKIWRMVHATDGSVPPAVQADLIKFTVRAAGLDGSTEKGGSNQQALQININL